MAKLTEEARKLINDYMQAKLKFWGSIAGILNIAALLGAGTYIFFILPSRLAEDAARSVEDLPKRAYQVLLDATTKAISSEARIATIEERARRFETENLRRCEDGLSKAEARLRQIDQKLTALSDTPSVTLASAFRELRNSGGGTVKLISNLSLLNFDNSGNLGIGGTPKFKLDVEGGIASHGVPLIRDISIASCPSYFTCKCPTGWQQLPGDLNEGARGNYIAICLQRATS